MDCQLKPYDLLDDESIDSSSLPTSNVENSAPNGTEVVPFPLFSEARYVVFGVCGGSGQYCKNA